MRNIQPEVDSGTSVRDQTLSHDYKVSQEECNIMRFTYICDKNYSWNSSIGVIHCFELGVC
jgi:hypothetical protein